MSFVAENPSEKAASGKPAPFVKGAPIIGVLNTFLQDPLTFLLELRAEHGDVVRFKVGPSETPYLVAHPEGVKRILQDNHFNYHKSSRYARAKRMLGNGLLVSDGDFWLRQRRLMQPMFHRKRLEDFADVMVEETERMIPTWHTLHKTGEPLDMYQSFSMITLSVISQTMFSSDVTSDATNVGEALAIAIEETNARMNIPFSLPDSIPTPAKRRLDRAMQRIDDVVLDIMNTRRAELERGEDKSDLLSMLMNVQDADTGERMSDQQVRDEAMTIFLAGHETTANALAWTLDQLGRHPEVLARLQDEVDSVLAKRTARLEDLSQLVYTEKVIKESLRLYPTAWAVGRHSLQQDEVMGYNIEAGSNVFVSPYITHRHPEFWDEPERFAPERFSPEREAERHRFAYIPFVAGPRVCIGQHFAMMETKLVLATFLQHFSFEHVDQTQVFPQPMMTLGSKHGINMRLQAR